MCWIIKDMLVCDIYPLGGHPYHYTKSNISKEIALGLTSKQTAKDISKVYEEYILSNHFYCE